MTMPVGHACDAELGFLISVADECDAALGFQSPISAGSIDVPDVHFLIELNVTTFQTPTLCANQTNVYAENQCESGKSDARFLGGQNTSRDNVGPSRELPAFLSLTVAAIGWAARARVHDTHFDPDRRTEVLTRRP
jgi:hypothetical protein